MKWTSFSVFYTEGPFLWFMKLVIWSTNSQILLPDRAGFTSVKPLKMLELLASDPGSDPYTTQPSHLGWEM